MIHLHFRVSNRYSVLGAYVILLKHKETMKIYHLHRYLSRTQFWLGKRKMNFGFQEIVGEVVGLLVTYAFHQDCRINVEIMKARDFHDRLHFFPQIKLLSCKWCLWIPDEDYGSPSLCFPYETRQPMRCLPAGHSLLEIVEDQLCKQHEFIRKVL